MTIRSECGSKHSQFYIDNHDKSADVFFLKHTRYDSGITVIVCESFTSTDFRELFDSRTLKGQDVVNIIDIENLDSKLQNCDIDIRGNLVLANSLWNESMGQLCSNDVTKEKIEIYGDIYRKALNDIKQCCIIRSVIDIGAKIGFYVSFIAIGIILFVIGILVIIEKVTAIYTSHTKCHQLDDMDDESSAEELNVVSDPEENEPLLVIYSDNDSNDNSHYEKLK